MASEVHAAKNPEARFLPAQQHMGQISLGRPIRGLNHQHIGNPVARQERR
jgi:hypothetical protein